MGGMERQMESTNGLLDESLEVLHILLNSLHFWVKLRIE